MKPKHALALLFALSFSAALFGQTTFREEEKLANLKDGVTKKEISSFAIAGRQSTSGSKPQGLKKVRFVKCGDSLLVFDNGFFSADIYVIIASTGVKANKRISEIRFVRDTKRIYLLPESAFRDLYSPNFCTPGGKKNKTDCKVFWSKKSRQYYIYMLNGSGENRYEVTWVIQSGVYYTRVVDRVQ
ncbi:hypothetical protein [Foetidibacter luteolus]|uniref:hypothetical protein n=1 Tax=Foetidibacter luteolus TaxID=2608880 RepID=UPI00129B4BE9|nr:hypothetical protein [Foetidibacter luteolus]